MGFIVCFSLFKRIQIIDSFFEFLTLGIQVSYAHRYHEVEVIPVSHIVAPLGKVEVQSRGQLLWITISFDHVLVHCFYLTTSLISL